MMSETEYLHLLSCPAFTAAEGKIQEANAAALRCFLVPGEEVDALICTGRDELAALEDGSLCLSLMLNGVPRGAAVQRIESGKLLFVLEDEDEEEIFRVLGLAAQKLRRPLGDAMMAVEAIQDSWEPDEIESRRMAELNRGLYAILRELGNMTEMGQTPGSQTDHRETTEVRSFFGELFEKAKVFAEISGWELAYTLPLQQIPVMLDRDRMERAFYNLLSNAMRFTPKGGKIAVSLTTAGRQLILRIQDSGEGLSEAVRANLFSRYRRTETGEDYRYGIGLGLPLVRKAAKLHGGSLLVCPGQNGGTIAALTFERKMPSGKVVKAPRIRFDYSGERDHALVELSGELAAELYEDL